MICCQSDPAYPNTSNTTQFGGGLTKREDFAVKILAGILSDHSAIEGLSRDEVVSEAVHFADSLILALNTIK